METTAPWTERARRVLLDRQDPTGAWGHRVGGEFRAEVTALAGLALKSGAAARWLASIQRADGSVPATSGPGAPGWVTPHALLLWTALGGFERPVHRATDWLLDQKGKALELSPADRNVLGHDPTLIGWPWVDETCSWLEPTAMAISALQRAGLADHFRVREGVQLILNRAIPGGGWNYGNNVVFGTVLRPQIAPTALALLALKTCSIQSPAVTEGAAYLREAIRDVRAPVSLGWAVMALRAHRACPDEAGLWLEESFERHGSRPDAALGLALLLIASVAVGGRR